MSAADKKKYLDNLKAQEEFNRIKQQLNLDEDGDAKVKNLKREIMQIDRSKERNQKNKSFSIIQELVNKELTRQEDIQKEQQQREFEARIKNDQRGRKTMQTTKTIFAGEAQTRNGFLVDRDPTELEK